MAAVQKLSSFWETRTPVTSSSFVISCMVGALLSGIWVIPVTSSMVDENCDSVTKLYASDLDLKVFRDSSSNPSYYRYLMVDRQSNFIFVGAMNKIFGLYLENIENPTMRIKQEFRPSSDSVYQCKINGKIENPDCQNHIRFLVRNTTSTNSFYMCSTGAFNPTAYQLRLSNNRFMVLKDEMSGLGICPYDPDDNTTATLVQHGAPGNIPSLFAASVADFIKTTPVIVRPDTFYPNGSLAAKHVRTLPTRTDRLNEPQFVGSFDLGEYVYFFFREVAMEFTNCGKKIYSRVVRVCKNDRGGGNLLDKTRTYWISFVKARLNCSIPGEYPYYFDEIQDVFLVGDTFYGLFTTNSNGLTASAICGFHVANIDRAFSGAFKHQRDKQSIWLPVPEVEVPTPRPGNCRAKIDNENKPDAFTNFISRLPMLMDKAVSQVFGKPIYYKSDCLMQKLVVVNNVAGQRDLVFFTASNTGVIYKIAAWPGLTPLDAPKTYTVTNYIPFNDHRPIWSLKFHRKWIYFGTDVSVGQISVVNCDKYKKIDLCIYDPYCGWDNGLNECRSNERNNLINYAKIDLLSYSLEEAIRKQVKQLFKSERLSRTSGSSVTMKVEYKLHISGSVRWTKNKTDVEGDRHILAKDNSLIVTDLRKSDEGVYEAKNEQGHTVAHYTLLVETNKEQIEQRWMRKFDQWCDEFERYQEDIRHWEQKCSNCCGESTIANMVPALGGK